MIPTEFGVNVSADEPIGVKLMVGKNLMMLALVITAAVLVVKLKK